MLYNICITKFSFVKHDLYGCNSYSNVVIIQVDTQNNKPNLNQRPKLLKILVQRKKVLK